MPSLRQRFSRFAPYFAAGRLGLAVAAIGSLVSAASEGALAWLMKPLLDEGFTGNRLPVWAVPAAIIGIFATRGLAGYLAECALAWSAQRGIEAMRRHVFDHLLRVQPALFTRHSASSLTAMVVHETQAGVQQLVGAILTVFKDSLTVAVMLGLLLFMNWQLTLIVALLVPGVGVVMRLAAPRLRRLTLEGQAAVNDLAYVVEENVLAWRVVRLHNAAPVERERFERRTTTLRRLMLKSVAAGAALTPLSQLLAATAVSVVIAVALHQSARGSMTVGGFVQFVTAMMALLQPIKRLSDVTTPITRGLAYLERGMGLLHDTPAESGGSYRPSGRASGEIALQEVSLRYREDHAPALDRLSLQIHPGETVALVGPSGAGKSSLVHLLPRFIDPSGGQITLDGHPLAEWDIAALRAQFALVSQDVVLFNDTVAANVALGDAIDEARVREALRSANLLQFVESLPEGLNTPVGHNGSQLSGGQRQRLAIARAIYKDAPILILDEATSALDSESERAVQQALDTLMHGRTTLVIAHRLSTIERADRIVAMETGRVVEQGTHAELLAHGGLYARLHAMQFRT
ncbi:lipid A export permease/ATP-binding protein MsbA [Ideonella sp. BN130291]|uniref:lipid A export permease/ATP-binding protein MsbA n=1 Tax=Ideonella sp. BN130291 TaxID=3112940 RepID=UPI002E256EF7|nr:lipid A export permease/ATP-binding protein MsbA [Ideonella sp. BN130291]